MIGLLSCFGVSDTVNPYHLTPRRPPLIIIKMQERIWREVGFRLFVSEINSRIRVTLVGQYFRLGL